MNTCSKTLSGSPVYVFCELKCIRDRPAFRNGAKRALCVHFVYSFRKSRIFGALGLESQGSAGASGVWAFGRGLKVCITRLADVGLMGAIVNKAAALSE